MNRLCHNPPVVPVRLIGLAALGGVLALASCSSADKATPVTPPAAGSAGPQLGPGEGGRPGGGRSQPGDGPVAAPPPSGASGQLQVATEPSGATVFVNGRVAGATPLTLDGLLPGPYGLRLEKLGRAPKYLRLALGAEPLAVREELTLEAAGGLEVDVQPPGAEVLLDGELAGLAPLKLAAVPAGQHELVIRKTNYKPFTAVVSIQPALVQRYGGFALEDRILEMLNGLIQAEPYRVAHYLDKGHYLFINNRMAEAARAYVMAREMSERPLELPPELDETERLVEQRLRGDDRRRLMRELEKHRSPHLWPDKDIREFSVKLDEVAESRSRENLGSWTWVQATGRSLIESGQLTRAEQVYSGHLERVTAGPSLYPCGLELLKARLGLRNVTGAAQFFPRLLTFAQDRPDRLLEVGRTALQYQTRIRAVDKDDLLDLAEQALRQALKAAETKEQTAACAFELANALTARRHPAAALPYYEQSVAGAPDVETREERSLQYAEALRLAGRRDEARALYQSLAQSARAGVSEKAKAGLSLLDAPPRE